MTTLAGYNIALIKDPRLAVTCICIALLVVFLVLLYIGVHTVQWIFARRQFGIELVHSLRALRHGYASLGNRDGGNDLLPDRLQNPDHYQDKNLTNFGSTAATN